VNNFDTEGLRRIKLCSLKNVTVCRLYWCKVRILNDERGSEDADREIWQVRGYIAQKNDVLCIMLEQICCLFSQFSAIVGGKNDFVRPSVLIIPWLPLIYNINKTLGSSFYMKVTCDCHFLYNFHMFYTVWDGSKIFLVKVTNHF
jgi:hypothetical protein